MRRVLVRKIRVSFEDTLFYLNRYSAVCEAYGDTSDQHGLPCIHRLICWLRWTESGGLNRQNNFVVEPEFLRLLSPCHPLHIFACASKDAFMTSSNISVLSLSTAVVVALLSITIVLLQQSRVALKMATAVETDKMAALATAANEARGLAMDSIAAAHSGHMGLPLGAAEIGASLWGSQVRTC
jgi:hypothetical protein